MGRLFFLFDLWLECLKVLLELIDDLIGLIESCESILILLDLHRDLGSLIHELSHEHLNEGQIGCGRHIVVPSQLVVEVLRLGSDGHVEMDGGLRQYFEVVTDLQAVSLLFVLAVGDRVQGVLGPRIVPINCGAVDYRWELSASISEALSDRRESEHNVQSFTTQLYEVGVDGFSSLSNTIGLGFVLKLVIDGLFFFRCEQVWNLTRVKKIVDVFKEGLLHDLSV